MYRLPDFSPKMAEDIARDQGTELQDLPTTMSQTGYRLVNPVVEGLTSATSANGHRDAAMAIQGVTSDGKAVKDEANGHEAKHDAQSRSTVDATKLQALHSSFSPTGYRLVNPAVEDLSSASFADDHRLEDEAGMLEDVASDTETGGSGTSGDVSADDDQGSAAFADDHEDLDEASATDASEDGASEDGASEDGASDDDASDDDSDEYGSDNDDDDDDDDDSDEYDEDDYGPDEYWVGSRVFYRYPDGSADDEDDGMEEAIADAQRVSDVASKLMRVLAFREWESQRPRSNPSAILRLRMMRELGIEPRDLAIFDSPELKQAQRQVLTGAHITPFTTPWIRYDGLDPDGSLGVQDYVQKRRTNPGAPIDHGELNRVMGRVEDKFASRFRGDTEKGLEILLNRMGVPTEASKSANDPNENESKSAELTQGGAERLNDTN